MLIFCTRMDTVTRRVVSVSAIAVCVAYIIDSLDSRPLLEIPGATDTFGGWGGRDTRKKHTRNSSPSQRSTTPWIKLPDLDGFLPTYLKYKEKLLTPNCRSGIVRLLFFDIHPWFT